MMHYTVTGLTKISEEGGWRHELAFDVDGQRLVIIDDTDSVEAWSDDPEFLIATVKELWEKYAMGCSHFPAVPVPSDLPSVPWADKWPKHLRWNDSGVELSHYATIGR